jgi:hypothetical protein
LKKKIIIRPPSRLLDEPIRELGFTATVPRVLPLLEVAERMAGGEETANTGVPAEVEMGLDFSRWGEVPTAQLRVRVQFRELLRQGAAVRGRRLRRHQRTFPPRVGAPPQGERCVFSLPHLPAMRFRH